MGSIQIADRNRIQIFKTCTAADTSLPLSLRVTVIVDPSVTTAGLERKLQSNFDGNVTSTDA